MEWTQAERDALVTEHLDIIRFRVDQAGHLLALEGAGLLRVGLRPESFQDLSERKVEARSIFGEADPPTAYTSASERAFQGDTVQLQLRWRGEYFSGTLVPRVGRSGAVTHVDGVWTLIPRLRLAGSTDGGLSSLMNHVAGMAYRCRNDEAWTMELVSDGCLALTGHTVEELRDNATVAFGDLVHPGDVDWLWEKCQSNLDAGRFCSNQYRIRHANGEIRWVWDRAQGVYDDEGKLCFIEGLVTDITAEKKEEAAREDLREQLQQSQKMEVVGQLAGGMAHDFNNLLLVIGGNIQLARTRPEVSQQCLSDASHAVERATELIGQLLTFGRRAPMEPVWVIVDDFITEHVAFIARLLPPALTVSVEPHGSPLRICVDATQLRQVLSNLCLNARDAMTGSGTLTIKTHHVNLDADFVKNNHWANQGNFVVISVADTGSGMSQETREQIFEPFFTTKPVGAGTGLGLAVTHSIVEQHDGFVRVESTLGEGTTFELFLPALDAIEEAAPQELARDHGALTGSETILVVEDQTEVLKTVTSILTGAGYKVLAASNGAEGIGAVAANVDAVKLVLMDVRMPGVSGVEASERIGELHPAVPILFTSGYTAELATGLQGKPTLKKPYAPEDLLRIVRESLDRGV